MIRRLLVLLSAALAAGSAAAQTAETPRSELRLNLNGDGSHYLKATFLNQTWLRWNRSNPGTTVNGERRDETLDIGIRSLRFQLFGQLTDHAFFYTQFGMNNFNFLSQNAGNRKLQAFFHDALGEYKVWKRADWLKIGGGLTVLSGLSRFSQPSTITIMTTDLPVFLQPTVDQTDEFARKLSVYARGQVGRLDYRLALSDPFPVQTNGAAPPAPGADATFTTYGHSHQLQGLFIWNFLEKEPHATPYMAGTYLGDRKVLNLEAGAIYQPRATWTAAGGDTAFHKMLHLGLAAFLDVPLAHNKYAVSAYAGCFHTDYGPRYVRNNGLMNPANGNADPAVFNGAGNAYPMFGTGNSIYAQAGFRLPNDLLGEAGTLMPYASYRRSGYERLRGSVDVCNAGVNWLISRHTAKLSLNYELRPVFLRQPDGSIAKTSHRGGLWLQYQTAF